MSTGWMLILAAAQLVALAGCAAGFYRWQRRVEANAAAVVAMTCDGQTRTLLAELRAQSAMLQSIAGGLERLDGQLRVDGRHATTAIRGGRAGYELAIRLANSGASIDELCASCGMTQAEAELLVRLHRAGNSPSMSRRMALAG
jgi:hypothetical protein